RPLIDQQDEELAFGMVVQDAPSDLLEEDSLAGARRGHDQAALSFADGRDQVKDPHGDAVRIGFQAEAMTRGDRCQVLETDNRSAWAIVARGLLLYVWMLGCDDQIWAHAFQMGSCSHGTLL